MIQPVGYDSSCGVFDAPNIKVKGWKRIFWIPIQGVFFVILFFYVIAVLGMCVAVRVIKGLEFNTKFKREFIK
jgi:hypothetical protein